MTDKIIPFTPKVTPSEPKPNDLGADAGGLIMVCSRCNCRTWLVVANGTVECANCYHVVAEADMEGHGEWRRSKAYEVPEDTDKTDAATINVRSLGSVYRAKKSTEKSIKEMFYNNETGAIFGFNKNGATYGWADVETDEQREWVIRKLQDYLNHFQKLALGESKSDG